MNWFTSDTHFNHYNIIEYCGRPFKSWQEMNEKIINNFNERVGIYDTTYFIGDFKLSSSGANVEELIGQLNGRKVFIRGNHDRNNGVNTILEYAIIKTFGKKCLLVHRPEDAERIMRDIRIDLAVVGHVHNHWKFKDKMVNVSVDAWEFYPVHMKQILKAYGRWKHGGKVE